MTTEHARGGALEALERVLNRGGDADDVLRATVRVLHQLYPYVRIDFLEGTALAPGPALGDASQPARRYPIRFDGARVAELVAGGAGSEDDAFLERVATIVSPYCLVGWDTGGEAWAP